MAGFEIENPKRFFAAVGTGLVLLVVIVVWVLRDTTPTPDPMTTGTSTSTTAADDAVTETTGTSPAGTNPETTTTTSTPTADPVASLYTRPTGTPATTWWKDLFRIGTSPDNFTFAAWSNPNNSDVEVDKAASLAEAGKRVAIADLSGTGRDQFPAYFAQAAPQVFPVGNLSIRGAAVAADSGIGPGWVRVSVLWSGDVVQPDGTITDKTDFYEVAFSPDGGWHPVQCKDAPVPDACASYVLPVRG